MKSEIRPKMEKVKARIAVVNSHPIQYFAPLYAYLNASGSFEITALYCTDFSLREALDPSFQQVVAWDVDLLEGYEARFLGERAKTRIPGGFWSLVCPEIWSEIRFGKYDAIVLHGHNYAVNLLALLAAKTTGTRIFMRNDSHLGLQRGRMKRVFRTKVLSFLYYFCDRCLAIGTANEQFFRAMGVREGKVIRVPFTVDNHRFMQASTLSEEERLQVLKRLGAQPDKPVVLYVSKFAKYKHPEVLLEAIALLRDRGQECTVLMVGSGEEQDELERMAEQLMLKNVCFPGFVNQSELPGVFGASDIFVLPAENEAWGLVVNEAMCASLPIVIADEIGCVPDLVGHEDNGYLFAVGDVDGLARVLQPLLSNASLRKRMGKRSRQRIERWGYAECLKGLLAALA